MLMMGLIRLIELEDGLCEFRVNENEVSLGMQKAVLIYDDTKRVSIDCIDCFIIFPSR